MTRLALLPVVVCTVMVLSSAEARAACRYPTFEAVKARVTSCDSMHALALQSLRDLEVETEKGWLSRLLDSQPGTLATIQVLQVRRLEVDRDSTQLALVAKPWQELAVAVERRTFLPGDAEACLDLMGSEQLLISRGDCCETQLPASPQCLTEIQVLEVPGPAFLQRIAGW